MTIKEFLDRLSGGKKSGSGWQARCPAHDDETASLSVSESPDGKILLHCKAGCTTESVVAKMNLAMKDLFPLRSMSREPKPRIVATYPYRDEQGNLLFECVRYEPKNFKQRRPDPDEPGKWIWNLRGVRRVLYRLRELIAAISAGQTIYIAEGEKDVDALVKHGFVATCNPLGAKKDGSSWLPEHNETLRGTASVVVVADKDETGRAHGRIVAAQLRPVASSLKLVELPDQNGVKVKDAADFFAAGGSADELRTIVETEPEFIPEPELSAAKPDIPASEHEPEADDSNGQKRRKSAATRLIDLAKGFAFFHDLQDRAFVRIGVNNHTEVWAVNSLQFRNLLAKIFWQKTRNAINRNALADAVATIDGIARHDSPEEPVFLRVARHGNNILIDLCDLQWRVIEVAASGWRVLEKSPVAFIRTGAMRPLPLPAPAAEGSLNPLWELFNVTPAQRPLLAGAILVSFHPEGPYFVTNFVGEQGSAKSCAARILRTLVDPNENPLRSPPREERDLLVQAMNNWSVVLDNLSGLPAWLSDGLCRLATGGGHSARQLYSDAEEFTLAVKRPVILTGIDDVATRPDLAERALQIELESIPDDRRMPERELWSRFETARPVIFCAILNALVCALRELPNVQLDSLPRMADAALWVTAGETALGWKTGTFINAYLQNLDEGATASLEAHPVGIALRQLLDRDVKWAGEAAQLLKVLNESVSEELRHSQNWPKNPRTLSACLRRLAQALRRAGFDLEFVRGKRRTIQLCKRADSASSASPKTDAQTPADANDAQLPLLHGEVPLVEELI
jgi:hypothetical protein